MIDAFNFGSIMSPRRYRMSGREAAVAKTRRRIVEATLELHGRKGIFGTSWQDIAKAADVSVGSVYKHFPSLEQLLPACGGLLMERARPPSPDDLPDIIGDAVEPRERLRRAVAVLFAFYERGGQYLESDAREREIPEIRQFEQDLRDMVTQFVSEAAANLQFSGDDVLVASAMADLPSFRAMAVRGVGLETAVEACTNSILAWLSRPR